MNTLINSAFIHEIEGADDFGELETDAAAMAEQQKATAMISKLSLQADDSSCSRTFRLLKKLVEQWFKDVTEAQNHIADHLLQVGHHVPRCSRLTLHQ